MPLSINVGLSKKASRDFQSTGYSINVTAELDQSLLARPDELQRQIGDLYSQAAAALNQQAGSSPAPQSSQNRRPTLRGGYQGRNGNGYTRNTNGNGNGRGAGGNGQMTASQRRAILAIAERIWVDANQEAIDIIGGELDSLTIRRKHRSYPEAKKIYDKLVREKTAKGYTPGEDGTPYLHTDKSDRATGIVPQLLNVIDEADVQKYVASADWWAQEKFDGRRVLIRRAGDEVIGINRLGLAIDPPKPLVSYARTIGGGNWLIDSEAIGDTFYAFDLLEDAGADLRKETYRRRLNALTKVVGTDPSAPIRAVETATTSTAKQVMLARLKASNREGIVFKRHTAKFSAGRPASGGDWVKFKFVATASCIVVGVKGGKRSVALELLDGQRRVGVGNVTIPPNVTIPAAGNIAEIRYLYAYPGGSLFQPVYLGQRDDLTVEHCRLDQLKFKADDTEGT